MVDLDLENGDGHGVTYDGDTTYEPGQPQSALMNYTVPHDTGLARKFQELWTADWLAGQRIRVTIASNSCIAAPDHGATTVKDIDLFLFRVTGTCDEFSCQGVWVYGSQSIDDNTEGFDWQVPRGGSGVYRVIAGWEEGLTACDGGPIHPIGGTGVRL